MPTTEDNLGLCDHALDVNWRFFHLCSDEYTCGEDEVWVGLADAVARVETAKVNGCCCDGDLAQEETFAELLDKRRKEYVQAVKLVWGRILEVDLPSCLEL